jgi:GntR family transcriptional regulator
MIIAIDLQSPSPLYAQIVDGVVRAIASGSLHPGDRLPPGRELAATLDVNLETVQRAYRDLAARGIVDARVGRGTRIRDDVDPEALAIGAPLELLVDMARSVDMPLDRLLAAVEQRYRRARPTP